MREPDVEYIVPDGLELPREVRSTLTHYIGVRVTNRKTGESGTKFVIPAYLMREWLEKYRGKE
jgi:hypothetical protein